MSRFANVCGGLAVLALVATGCGGDDPVLAPAATVADGDACLAAADYDCALRIYAEVIPAGADELARIRTGVALASLGRWLKDVGRTLVATARMFADAREGSLSGLAAGLVPGQDNLAGDGIISRTVFGLLNPELQRLDGVIATFDTALTTPPAAPLTYARIPLLVGNVPVFLLTGQVGVADLSLMRSWLHLAGFLLETALAVDLEFSLLDVADHAKTVVECQLSDDRNRRTCLGKLLAYAVGNTPNLLGPEPTRGRVFRLAQRKRLAAFFGDAHAFFQGLSAETEPAAARQLTWRARPQGGAWIEWRFLRVPVDDELIGELLAERSQAPSFAAALTTHVRFIVDPGVVEAMDAARDHLLTGTPQRLEVATTLLPVVTVGLEFLQQSDAVVRLVQIIAEGIDPDFAADLAELSQDVRGLYSDVGSADAVHRLFEFLLPSSLQVDLEPLFTHPDYLRLLLPAATSEVTDGNESWRWLTEWECDDALVDLGFCIDGAVLEDAPHFTGTPYALTADTILSPVGYSAFVDPGFGGMLWFDPWQVDPRFARGVTSPDLEQLNRLAIDVGIELQQRLAAAD